jgi:hypothetical protein
MKNLRKLAIVAACSALCCSLGCGGGSSSSSNNGGSSSPTQTIASSGANVAPITVNTGPAAVDGESYANGAFASATVCVPGTSTCQTVDGLLVDTGSVGLRIVSSVLTIALPQQNSATGSPIVECLQFLESYSWGPVQTADITVASEKASAVPIHVLSDTDFSVPSSCTSTGPSADTLETLGTNGILGVGLFAQDCGAACVQSALNPTPPPNAYYECTSASSCQPTFESLTQQVQNPVALFGSDNNGVIIELPAVSGAESTVSGSLVFGIGTQTNNALGGATVYTADASNGGTFTTAFNGGSYPASFIDSGSNGYFFPDSGIAQCSSSSGASGFYCPASTVNLSATNQGSTAGSGTVDFSIADAVTLFSNSGDDAAFGDLGGSATGYFDWGLPFFYGHNVFAAIEGTSAPGGTPPYWAY